jgi:hypothetical protein
MHRGQDYGTGVQPVLDGCFLRQVESIPKNRRACAIKVIAHGTASVFICASALRSALTGWLELHTLHHKLIVTKPFLDILLMIREGEFYEYGIQII